MTSLDTSQEAKVQHVMDYILARLATSFGQKADNFVDFIAMGLRAEGWFATEALHYLSGAAAKHMVKVEQVRGPAQGDGGFNPDLQLNILGESHQLAIKSMPISGGMDIAHYFSNELPDTFRWLADLRDRAALFTVAYPCSTTEQGWVDAARAAEDSFGVKLTGQTEFVIPRPPLPMVKACVALWRHASVMPETEENN